jgi:drug/metabolite transporter (DMT)-like permease
MTTHEHSAYDRLGLVAALVAPVAWGLTGIFIRLLQGLPPMTIVVGRLLVASVALGLVLVLRRPGRRSLRWSSSSLAMAGYYVLATEAFVRAPVVEVTLLVGMAPVLALGIHRLRGRTVPAQQLLGVILAVGGLVAFLLPGKTRADPKLTGDLLALGAAAASAIYATQLRRMAASDIPPDPVCVAAIACLVGAIAGAALVGIFGSHTYPAVTVRDVGILVLLGALSTALPTAAFSIASARLPTVLTTSFGLSTPLFTALFAGTVLQDWPAPATLPGALITLLGLALVVRSLPTSPVVRLSGRYAARTGPEQ